MSGCLLESELGRMIADLEGFSDPDMEALKKKIGNAMVSSTQERFDSQTSPNGTRWKTSYRAASEGGQTLTDTAVLKNSITFQTTAGGVEIGTNVKYAGIHQDGATIRPKKKSALRFRVGDKFVTKKSVTIVARPFLGISNDDEEEIDGTIADHVRGRYG